MISLTRFREDMGNLTSDVFEKNSRQGDGIVRTSELCEGYLRYFIDGPALPPVTIERFRKLLIEDSGTSGMVMDQLCKFVRAETQNAGIGTMA